MPLRDVHHPYGGDHLANHGTRPCPSMPWLQKGRLRRLTQDEHLRRRGPGDWSLRTSTPMLSHCPPGNVNSLPFASVEKTPSSHLTLQLPLGLRLSPQPAAPGPARFPCVLDLTPSASPLCKCPHIKPFPLKKKDTCPRPRLLLDQPTRVCPSG